MQKGKKKCSGEKKSFITIEESTFGNYKMSSFGI